MDNSYNKLNSGEATHHGSLGLCTCTNPGGRGFKISPRPVPIHFFQQKDKEREKEERQDGKWKLNLTKRLQVVAPANINCKH